MSSNAIRFQQIPSLTFIKLSIFVCVLVVPKHNLGNKPCYVENVVVNPFNTLQLD